MEPVSMFKTSPSGILETLGTSCSLNESRPSPHPPTPHSPSLRPRTGPSPHYPPSGAPEGSGLEDSCSGVQGNGGGRLWPQFSNSL